MYCFKIIRYSTCIFLISILSGCINSQKMATHFTTAPNQNKTIEQLGSYSSEQLNKYQYDWQDRIIIDNNTSLHVAGIEPKTEWGITSGNIYRSMLDAMKNKTPDKIPDKIFWDYENDNSSNLPLTFKPVGKKLWQKPRGTVIILPGIYVPKTTMYYWANIMAVYGYQTISIDLPGQGLSTGKHILYGNKTAEPIIAAIDYLEKQGKLHNNLILFGCSHGAATALHTAALDDRIDKVIAMEPYSSIKKASLDFISTEMRIPKFLVNLNKRKIYNAIDIAGEIVGFDPKQETTLAAIKNTSIPILLIHGSKDKHLPPIHSRELLNAAPDNTTLLIVDGAHHMNLPIYSINFQAENIDKWLKENHVRLLHSRRSEEGP